MTEPNSRRTTVVAVGGALAVAAVLAGCGSSSNGYGSHSPTTAASSGGAETSIAATTGSLGAYLTDNGRSVYLWEGDHGMTSSCTGPCASVWPPVTTMGSAKAGAGVNAAELGTTHRSDGTTQVTYNGHPLYFYASDTSAGQTNGEGVNGFGASWYLMQPSGMKLDHDTSSSSPSPSVGYGGY